MIRRKSTIDHAERQKRTKQVQIFAILDLCLQLPSDDRLLIRNCIKNGQEEPAQRIYQCKKDKNYHHLQIWLRKYVARQKEHTQKYPFSVKGKIPCSSSTLTIKSKNQTQSSLHNSLHNSLHSSPSTTKKSATKISMTKQQIQKHIQQEINMEIKCGIQGEQCQMQSRDITPREILKEIHVKQYVQNKQINGKIENEHREKVSQFSKRISQNLKSQPILTLKDSIKHKIVQKQRNTLNWQNPIRYTQANICSQLSNTKMQNGPNYQFYKPREPLIIRNGNENDNKSYGVYLNDKDSRINQNLKIEVNSSSREVTKNNDRVQQVQYGEFYKRIKRVIDEAY